MLVEAPVRVLGGGAVHVAIAGDLGDDRGGGDRGAGAVALDHGPVRDSAAGQREAVGEAGRVRRRRQPFQRDRERFDVGHVQAAAVDPGGGADDDADPGRRPQHAGEHLQPPLLGHLLGVVQAGEGAAVGVREPLVVDQDRGGDQRPGQATPPGLVGAGDVATLEAAVEGEQAAAAGQPAAAACGT